MNHRSHQGLSQLEKHGISGGAPIETLLREGLLNIRQVNTSLH